MGINVPIHTVVLTQLTKFDGTKMRRLRSREFHQIVGRAGRAGFDTEGMAIALAPEHEIENHKALLKAGDDPKKQRCVKKKQLIIAAEMLRRSRLRCCGVPRCAATR